MGRAQPRRPLLCRWQLHRWGRSKINDLGHWETRCTRRRCRALLCYSGTLFR